MTTFPTISPDRRRSLLAPPSGVVDVVLDSDSTNEVDDQFAVVWSLLRPDRLTVRALTACPYGISPELLTGAGGLSALDARNLEFRLSRAGMSIADIPTLDPAVGVARAEADLRAWVELVAPPSPPPVLAGAPAMLADPSTPVDSPAARAIIDLALEPRDGPLYLCAIGAATNVASALLLAPEILDRVVVVWTAAYPSFWPHPNASFNLAGDPHAARVLFESGVPLHYIPGYYVGEELRVSAPEIEAWVRPHGVLGAALADLFVAHVLAGSRPGSSKVLWDLIVPAWLIEPRWLVSEPASTPTFDHELRWTAASDAPEMLEAVDVDRDGIFRDLYRRLEDAAVTD